MKKNILFLIFIVCIFNACDNEFLDLTTGKITINEVNGAKLDGPYISVHGDSKVYHVGNNIYDGTDYGANGNSNYCLDPGETIRYRIKVRNVGKQDAIAINAVISTNDTWVTDLQNTSHYIGFLKPEKWSGEYIGSFFTADWLLISIDSKTPRGHRLKFNIHLSDAVGNSWHDYFIIIVN